MNKTEPKKPAPKEQSTESDRKVGTTRVIKSDQIEQELGAGRGSKAPFGK